MKIYYSGHHASQHVKVENKVGGYKNYTSTCSQGTSWVTTNGKQACTEYHSYSPY